MAIPTSIRLELLLWIWFHVNAIAALAEQIADQLQHSTPIPGQVRHVQNRAGHADQLASRKPIRIWHREL